MKSKKQSLDILWTKICEQHKAILTFNLGDEDYFKHNGFDNMEQAYKEMNNNILVLLKKYKGDQEEDDDFSNLETNLIKLKTLVLEDKKMETCYKKQAFRFMELKMLIEEIQSEQQVPQTYYQRMNEELSSTWAAIKEIHEEIIINDVNIQQVYEITYNSLQQKFKTTQKVLDNIFFNITKQDQHKNSGGGGITQIKLEPISLEKFNGDFKKWKSFIETFTSLVANSQIPKIQKFHYLKNHLEDDAKKIIQHLLLTEDNYEPALNLIKQRFENNRKIKNSYIETILEAPIIQTRAPEQLIALHDLINESLQALDNLGCDSSNWGELLVSILSKKLDYDSYKNFEEHLENPKESPSLYEIFRNKVSNAGLYKIQQKIKPK